MNNQVLSFDDLPKAVNQIGEKLNAIQQMLALHIEPKKPPIQDKLLSVQEAASFLRLTVSTVYSKKSRGELPVMKQGNKLYFSQSELMEYVKKGKTKSSDEVMAYAENYLKKGRYE